MSETETVDVFVSFNSDDEPEVKLIAAELEKEYGLKVFFTPWDALPGQSAVVTLEQGMHNANSCAVFVGPSGLGPWQQAEADAALSRQIEDKSYPVIPVILPGGDSSKLPPFLKRNNHISVEEPYQDLDSLVRGIRKAPRHRHKARKRGDLAEFERLKETYLRLMSDDWRWLRLEGIDKQASDASGQHTMSLDQVYVGLLTTRQKGNRDEELLRQENSLSALEAVSGEHSCVVLLGQPGSGKSTFARYLAYCLAQTLLDGNDKSLDKSLPGWTLGPVFPVCFSLARLARQLSSDEGEGSAYLLERLIKAELEGNEDFRGLAEPLLVHLQDQGGLVLFDGLDEISGRLRQTVTRSIQRFSRLYDRCRVVCTCRTHSYRADAGWRLVGAQEYELAPFDGDQIKAFVERWYACLSQANPASRALNEEKRDKLLGVLGPGDPRQLATIAGNPLLLTVMTIVHTHYGELPDSRVQVYAKCVELLLERWSSQRTQGSDRRSLLDDLSALGIRSNRIYQAIRHLAYEALKAGEDQRFGEDSRGLASESMISGVLNRYLGADGVSCFLKHCKTDNGLLLVQGVMTPKDACVDEPAETIFGFPHLTFQEYLAACHLCRIKNYKDVSAELAGNSAWREVIRFLVEYLCFDEHGSDWDKANAVLKRLCKEAIPQNDADWRRSLLAGELAPVVLANALDDDDRTEVPRDRIQTRLVVLLENVDALITAPRDRAAAGRALAELGDPRPGVTGRLGEGDTVMPDIAWVPIPGTAKVGLTSGFKMGVGAGPGERASESENWPENEPGVVIESFYLAAYPVTYAQFGVFVDAEDGYMNNAHWSDAGIKARRDQKAPILLREGRWHIANHPVVGVTWYEAIAFCRWLTVRWQAALGENRWLIRLPTEAEWEWAARGPKGNCWPWGNEWSGAACNSEEGGVGRTTAVGGHPQNRNWVADHAPESALDALPAQLASGLSGAVYDLSGNVWEWCATKWRADYRAAEVHGDDQWSTRYCEGRDRRVLRGGAYWNEMGRVRGAARLRHFPRDWDNNWGFRCCCASTSSRASES